MKAAPFEYIRPKSVAEASVALGRRGANTAAIAGGQSLLPMLNLRVAMIDLLVDISRLDDLKTVTETPDSLWIGALTTHAAIEDGKTPDIFNGLMRRVAGPDLLPGGPQPRHHRRQRGAGRSRRRLAVLPDRARCQRCGSSAETACAWSGSPSSSTIPTRRR